MRYLALSAFDRSQERAKAARKVEVQAPPTKPIDFAAFRYEIDDRIVRIRCPLGVNRVILGGCR